MRFRSLNEQGGTTVKIASRDCQDMRFYCSPISSSGASLQQQSSFTRWHASSILYCRDKKDRLGHAPYIVTPSGSDSRGCGLIGPSDRDSSVQVVYLTFEWLGNLTRKTFAPKWSLNKIFKLINLVIKSFTKDLIWKYSETATPLVCDWTRWNLPSQVGPNMPSANFSIIALTFVWIVNFIFSGVHE